MVEAQAIFTEYHTHILRDIALYQRTGLLRVEYVGGHVVEKGAIFFQNGNVVFACTEQETGEKALMHIASWDKVYYSFKEAIHQGVHAVFRALPEAVTRQVMSQVARQDRVVFMLLDGKRTVHQIAQLVHRSELDVAHTVARLIKRGYVECVPEEEEDQRELDVARTLVRLLSSE
jgi:hypothetical protein